MSGKVIMKRKREDQQLKMLQAEQQQQQQQQQISEAATKDEKRQRLESTEPTNAAQPPSRQPAAVNRTPANLILIEALQKIMELQAELDEFEQELDEREAYAADNEHDSELDAEVASSFAAPAARSEAEALGFAMCARETLLFLQSEGVSTESPLYQTLLGKLVGQSDGLLQT